MMMNAVINQFSSFFLNNVQNYSRYFIIITTLLCWSLQEIQETCNIHAVFKATS